MAAATLPQPAAEEVAQLRSHAARGVFALALRYGAAVGLNAAGTIVVSRMLGPHQWGIYAVGQFLYLVAQEVFGRGIPAYLIRKAEQPTEEDLRAVSGLQNAFAAGFAVLIALAAFIAGHAFAATKLALVLAAAAVASLLFSWRSVPVAMLERQLQFGKLALVEVSDAVVFNATAVLLALLTHSLLALVVALLLRSLVPTLLVYPLARMRPSPGSLQRAGIRRVTHFGCCYAGASIAGMLVTAVPPLVLGPLAGSQALGYVQMATALYSTLLFATAAVLRVSFSAYSRLAQWPEQLRATVEDNLSLLASLQVPLIVFFAGLAPIWVPLVLGPRWTPMAQVIALQAPGYMMAAVFWGVLSSALFVTGKGRGVLLWLVCVAASYALLTGVLWSVTGSWLCAAAAWSLCYVVAAPVLLCLYAGTETGRLLKRLAVPVAAGTATAGGARLLMGSGHQLAAITLLATYGAFWLCCNRHQWPLLRSYVRAL